MNSRLVICLSVLSCMLSLQCVLAAEPLYQDSNSVEFQAINSYLTSQLQSQKEDKSAVIPILERAVYTMEAVGMDNIHILRSSDVGREFEPLIGERPRAVLAILKNIVSASKSCSQDNLNYLTIVVEHET